MRLALVVLVACSGGTPHEPTPPQPVAADATVASIDAIDAPVVSERSPRLEWCPPGPKPNYPCKERTTPPPKPDPIVLAIKKRSEMTADGVRITVDGGTNRGIDKTWKAVLIDPKQRAMQGGDLTYRRLDPDEIEGVVRLHPEQLEGLKSVRFTPP